MTTLTVVSCWWDQGVHENPVSPDRVRQWLKQPFAKILWVEDRDRVMAQLGVTEDDQTQIWSTGPREKLAHATEILSTTLPSQRNHIKDTAMFLWLMNLKTHWVNDVSQQNPFQSLYFMWMDVGLRKIFPDDETFEQQCQALASSSSAWYLLPSAVRMGRIWSLEDTSKPMSWEQVQWYMAGGVWGGDAEACHWFHETAWSIWTAGLPRLTWEVNIWYEIYRHHPERFSLYPCDHNHTLLSSWPLRRTTHLLTRNAVESTPLIIPRGVVSWSLEEYQGAAGREHYRVLVWLTQQWSGVEIIDVGTHMGASAAALTMNPDNHVLSFDIKSPPGHRLPNVEYVTADLWQSPVRALWRDRILRSAIIMLDIDHGPREWEFYQWLQAQNYQGLLVLDDIWFFGEMRDCLWSKIDAPVKWDLTPVGHWSGTGVVEFSGPRALSLNVDPTVTVPPHATDNWTLVTAFYALDQEPDATGACRSTEHYLSHAAATLGVQQHVVIFCAPAHRAQLEALRPAHLRQSHTRFYEMEFGDFPLVTQFRDRILEARRTHPTYHGDPRNTASYYLFCMLRYVMLLRVMADNPFTSTHFGWINICMERMGWRNLATLTPALTLQRNRFSTCWIDYQPRALVEDLPRYYEFGRCSMCSGFFTGRGDYMKQFCEEILRQFERVLEAGWGHADEQLYALVYYDHPELFEPYYGDYSEMITNYVTVQERASEPVRNLISHAFENGDYKVCLAACRAVWDQRPSLPEHLRDRLDQCYRESILRIPMSVSEHVGILGITSPSYV